MRFCKRLSYNVISAYGGEEGLKAAGDAKPDIILLDIMMPTVDGWTVLSRLKADEGLRHIPVVVHSIVNDKARGFSLGATDYLSKPVDRKVLSTVLKRYAGNKHHNFKILILEDDPDIQDIFRHTAEKQGWQVELATNGKIGLEKLQAQIPDIILLDIMMPEMNGLEFLATIRQRNEWSDIPVIVVTAKDLTEDDKAQLRGQAQRVIQKAVHTPSDLVHQIQEILSTQMTE